LQGGLFHEYHEVVSLNRQENADHSLDFASPSDYVNDCESLAVPAARCAPYLNLQETAGHSVDFASPGDAVLDCKRSLAQHLNHLENTGRSLNFASPGDAVKACKRSLAVPAARSLNHQVNAGCFLDFDETSLAVPAARSAQYLNNAGRSLDFYAPNNVMNGYYSLEVSSRQPIDLVHGSDSNSTNSATLLMSSYPEKSDLSFDPLSSKEITK
jgi:hypothetical protein